MKDTKRKALREHCKTRRCSDRQRLQNVISLRISDQEKRLLAKVTASTSRSVSDIMREAMDLWLHQRQRLCLDFQR